MASAPVDIPIKVKGLSDLQKLERRMEALEKEVTRLGKGLPKATNNVRNFGRASRGAAGGVKALGAAVKSALAPLLAVAAAVGSLSAAFRVIAGQDFALAKVRSLGVDSVALAAALKQVSAELEGNASVAELTAAAYDVASAGFTNAADAALVLKAASQGATGGFSDINTVADAATSVLNAYGKSAADAGRLIDGFIQTQNDGKIVVDQYAQNIGKVASAAAGLKVPIEEVNAVIAQSTAAGVQAEIAFTGLKGALARLASGEAANALKDVGIDISAATIEADGLLGTLKKLEGLDTGQILKALGTEAGPALLPVIQNLEKFEELLLNQENAAGAAARAQQEAANTINGAWKRVTVAVSNLFSDQAALAQAIIPILDAVANAVNGITEAMEGFKLVADAVRGTVDSLGEKLTGLSSFFGTLGESIKWAADQLGRLLLRADGFNDPGVQELMRTRVYDNSQGAGFDIEAIRKMSAAAGTGRKTQQTTIPGFNPPLSGGGSGGGANTDNSAEELENTAKRIRLSEQNLKIKEAELAIAKAIDPIEKLRLTAARDILKIEQDLTNTLDGEKNAIVRANEERAATIQKLERELELTGDITKEQERQAKAAEVDPGKLEQYIADLKADLADTEGMIVSLASTIESELSSAMSSSIIGIIDGTKSAEEAFADMFKNIGKAFIDMATKMIAKALIMKALGILGGGGGGSFLGSAASPGGSAGVAGIGGAGFVSPFADGGRPPTGEVSIVGERGPELFVPDSPGRVVPNNQSQAAMAQFNPGNESGGSGGPMNVTMDYSGPTMQFDDSRYVPVDAIPTIIKDAAKQGEARAMNTLKNSRGARSRIGI